MVDHIDNHFGTFERQMGTAQRCTAFAYDISRVEASYYNECIRVSSSASTSDPGARIQVSFSVLQDELTWGRYTGPPLPASLQFLLTRATQGTRQVGAGVGAGSGAGAGAGVRSGAGSSAGAGAGAGTWANAGRGAAASVNAGGGNNRTREGDPIDNPQLNARLRLHRGENTRSMLRETVLPAVNGGVFCKRWHLGGHCFTGCPRAASHAPLPDAVVIEVENAMAAQRAQAPARPDE